MQDLISRSSTRDKSFFAEKFLIKRIGEEDIEIGNPERMAIIKALDSGVRYVQVGKYTLMVNSIKSIDPKWGWENVPPRPKPLYPFDTVLYHRADGKMEDEDHKVVEPLNKEKLDEWDRLFVTQNAELNRRVDSNLLKKIGGDI